MIQKINISKGIYAFYKPKGITSYDLIRKIKKMLSLKCKSFKGKSFKNKIGHAGTLDPLASGVLVVGIGREFTKKLSQIMKEEKEYIAEIFLGAESTTGDEEGEKTKIKIDKKPMKKDVLNVVKKFIGKINQIPPLFSAVKIRGKPAYWYARRNKKITLTPRQVEIKNIKILKYSWPILKIKVICKKGVYIRSLAFDIGRELGVGGYLKNLIRTRIGNFKIKDCIYL